MRGIGLAIAGLAAAVLGPGCSKSESGNKQNESPAAKPEAMIDLHDPGACKVCHPTVAAEYQRSMHARAHHARDPIYAGIRAIRMKKEGAAIAKACERCHTPDAKAAATAGVTCFACHNLHAKAKAGVLLGPHDVAAGKVPVHGTGPRSAVFADGRKLCLTCHEVLKSPKGVAMCTTGFEHARVAGSDSKSCVDCHMPPTDGPGTQGVNRAKHASHEFVGPHHAWYHKSAAFVASGVALSARFESGGLVIELDNRSGHGFPTGFPGRMATLSCNGFDGAGKQAWTCEPIRLGKVYVDAAGKPTLAPYAAKLARDTRLKPGVKKAFQLKPPPQVKRVDVVLTMRLLPKRLAAKLKLTGKLEDEPRPIARVSATR